jgi:hypothetical protein
MVVDTTGGFATGSLGWTCRSEDVEPAACAISNEPSSQTIEGI